MWNGLSSGSRNFLLRFSGRVGLREGCQGRPEAARRGSLDSLVRTGSTMDEEARQGFLGASGVMTTMRSGG